MGEFHFPPLPTIKFFVKFGALMVLFLLGNAPCTVQKRPTPRAPDKCGRSAALSGFSPNGGFGVWWFPPPNPALAGNACRWAFHFWLRIYCCLFVGWFKYFGAKAFSVSEHFSGWHGKVVSYQPASLAQSVWAFWQLASLLVQSARNLCHN